MHVTPQTISRRSLVKAAGAASVTAMAGGLLLLRRRDRTARRSEQ
ncbi:twin-arginine translocation signal domain-containing protein [Streptomyces sp. NPDC001165]